MDESVKQALAKWPNVPHCYGWLALDARGAFRMRDEIAQTAQLPGDVIRHESLLAFIYRNYTCDSRGAWYFQNGPQRVYVELETTPFIVRSDPAYDFVFHDKTPINEIDNVYMTNEGNMILRSGHKIAMVDNHDLAHCLSMLYLDDHLVADDDLLQWLSRPHEALQIQLRSQVKTVEWIDAHQLESQLGFVARPSERNITSE